MICKSPRIGSSEILPIELIEIAVFDRQDVAQGRVLIAAGPKAVKPAEHDQSGSAFDQLPQAGEILRPKCRRIQVADDVDIVFARLKSVRQIDRPILPQPMIDPLEIDFDVGRRRQRPA